MRLRLYCSSDPSFVGLNEGIEDVMYLLWLISQGGILVEVFDTSRMSAQAIQAAYGHAQIPSIAKKLSIRRLYGSKTKSGYKFGKQVSALIVYDDNEYPVDIYPYSKGIHEGKTIRQYLFGLLPEGLSLQLIGKWVKARKGLGYDFGRDMLEYRLEYDKKGKPKGGQSNEKVK
jgi:hypothetical protein